MKIRILHEAELDLLEGYSFYEMQAAGVGDYFLDSLYATYLKLKLRSSAPLKLHRRCLLHPCSIYPVEFL